MDASTASLRGFPDLQPLRFVLTALDPIDLPAYPGSTWRGALGHGLRKSACVIRRATCDGCLLAQSCAYSLVFESPPADPVLRTRYSALPHPYVLAIDPGAERTVGPGAPLTLGINLIGSAITALPHLVLAMVRAGEWGIGRPPGRMLLTRVEQEATIGSGDWQPIYAGDTSGLHPLPSLRPVVPDCPDQARIELITPLRVKRDGRFIGPIHLEADDLVRHLRTRIGILTDCYGPPGIGFDWAPSQPAVGAVQLSSRRLHWHDWTRYSNRQHATMQLGGLLGELILAGPGLPALWPLLWIAQWTHLGKGTAFGLGQIRVVAA